MKRFLSVLLWSVISAAFIGPGTVTTAASAGAGYGFRLLWALVFSTVACFVLQEASARVTIASGQSLGESLREMYTGTLKTLINGLVLAAIILGCTAYEAGNLLGSVAGASLKIGVSTKVLTLVIGVLAFTLLFLGKTRTVARILGGVVALMGIAFLASAMMMKPNLSEILKGAFLPSIPHGSGLLVVGLIGTTVVPYNLFLGSGIAREEKDPNYRFGLTMAIVLGGIISMGVLIVGTSVTGTLTYQALSDSLSARLGSWAGFLFAFGLFAAGFSSAVTAPLAAALTARSLLGGSKDRRWDDRSCRYRIVWGGVLLAGLIFGLTDVRPIPAIIIAQALNGILLPLVAIFLLFIVNDRNGGAAYVLNRTWNNVIMLVVVGITIFLGITSIIRAFLTGVGTIISPTLMIIISVIFTIVILIPVVIHTLKLRSNNL